MLLPDLNLINPGDYQGFACPLLDLVDILQELYLSPSYLPNDLSHLDAFVLLCILIYKMRQKNVPNLCQLKKPLPEPHKYW